ncbi:MAG: T9SS type A sorting domain-containing protein [Paludibacter sp.]
MKTKILFFFCLIVVILNAQSYKSILANKSAKWTLMFLRDYNYTKSWYATNDTIVLGKSYTKMQNADSYWWPIIINFDYSKNNMDTLWKNTVINQNYYMNTRYLRESNDNSKVYFYDDDTKEEYLIMDLNLVKNDTFYLPGNAKNVLGRMNNSKTYVLVDSVFYKDELKNIQFSMKTSPLQYFTFTEGIGTNLGLFYMYAADNYNYDQFCLQCFQNNERFFKANNNPCIFDYNFNDVKQIKEAEYSFVLKNTDLNITANTIANHLIEIVDISGRSIYRSFEKNKNKIVVNTSQISTGIYLLKMVNISNPEKTVISKLLIH